VEQGGLGATARKDAWWVAPLLTFLGLSAFGVYTFWAILSTLGWDGIAWPQWSAAALPYMSPFYSPNLPELFGFHWRFWPFLILWVPLGFRGTCYYYRKAYYRSYFLDPPGCAVGEPTSRKYGGEAKFPFILQNLHRYFFYLATIVLLFLAIDAVNAFRFTDDLGNKRFGIGVGSIVLLLNVVFLSAFSFGCNSLRHLVGGKLDSFTCSGCARTRYKLWKGVTVFNLKHMEWAWVSLFWVGFADFYVRACHLGWWTDLRIF
jgi:hypothetical protein